MMRLLRTSDSVIPLILRLTLALVMFRHGAQKALGLWGGAGFSGTIAAMSGMGMPAVAVVLVILGEFLGSIGLAVGFLTRVAAFGIFAIMAGAVAIVHWPNGFFMNWFGNQKGE